MQKLINTFAQLDLSGVQMPIIVIYNSPKDYPGTYVARVWDMDKPTNIMMLKKKLSTIREDIKAYLPNVVRLPKAQNDDPCIVETWI